MILFVIGIALSGALGGVFNAINGWVSPLYFSTIMGWTGANDIWWANIEQGIKEATLTGCVLSALFAIGLAVISQGKCPFDLGLRFLMAVFAAISLCWTLGGMVAVVMALKTTTFYRQAFVGVPDDVANWCVMLGWMARFGGLMRVVRFR